MVGFSGPSVWIISCYRWGAEAIPASVWWSRILSTCHVPRRICATKSKSLVVLRQITYAVTQKQNNSLIISSRWTYKLYCACCTRDVSQLKYVVFDQRSEKLIIVFQIIRPMGALKSRVCNDFGQSSLALNLFGRFIELLSHDIQPLIWSLNKS